MQTAPGVFFRNGYDQAQIRLRQLVLGRLVTLGNAARQLDLLVGGQQAHLTDLLEVHPHRVVQIILCRQLQRIDQLFLFARFMQINGVHIHRQRIIGHLQIQLRTDDRDAQRVERIVDLLDLLDRQIQLFQLSRQLRCLDRSLALRFCDQRGNTLHRVVFRRLRIFCICHLSAHPHPCIILRSLCRATIDYTPEADIFARLFTKNIRIYLFSLFDPLSAGQISMITGKIIGLRFVVLKR